MPSGNKGTGNSQKTLPKNVNKNNNNSNQNNGNNNNNNKSKGQYTFKPKGMEKKKWDDLNSLGINQSDLGHLVGRDTFTVKNSKVMWTGITRKKTHDILDCMLDPATVTPSDHLPINVGNNRKIKSTSGSAFLQSLDNGRAVPSTGFSSIVGLLQDPVFPLWSSKRNGFVHSGALNDTIAGSGVGANNSTFELAYTGGQGHGALRFRNQGTRTLDQYMSMSFPAYDSSSGTFKQVFRRQPGDTIAGEIFTYGSGVQSVKIKQWKSTGTPTNEFTHEIEPNPAVAEYIVTVASGITDLIEKNSEFFSFEDIVDNTEGSGVLAFCQRADGINFTSIGPYALIGTAPAELPTMVTQVQSVRNNASALTCTYYPDHQYGGGSSLSFFATGGSPPSSAWLDFGFAKAQKWFGRLWDGSHTMRFPSIEEVDFIELVDLGKVPTTNPFQKASSMISLTFMDYTPTIAMTLESIPMQVKFNCWLEGVATNNAVGGETVNERSEAVKAILSAIASTALPSCNPSHQPYLKLIKQAADYIVHSDDAVPVALRKGLTDLIGKGSNLLGAGLDKVSDVIRII